MKQQLRVLLLCGAALLCAHRAAAQVVLNDFSGFVVTDQTFFLGEWSTGDDVTALTTFTQNSGTYSIVAASSADSAGALYYFSSDQSTTLDLTGYDSLLLTGTVLSDSTATTVVISLLDLSGNTAYATLSLASLASVGWTSAAFNLSSGFDLTSVVGFQITGGDAYASSIVSLTLDSLSAVSTTAVPEPSTYAALFGVAALGVVGWRRRLQAA